MIDINSIKRTTDGYLVQLDAWEPEVAKALAEHDHIHLTDEHWKVIYFLREYYLQYKTSPTIRALVKALQHKYGNDKFNSIYLHKLFPQGPAKQANKIAGLPKSIKCI